MYGMPIAPFFHQVIFDRDAPFVSEPEPAEIASASEDDFTAPF